MRHGLNILSDDLIVRILDEAKAILAEKGMEIRGPEMKQRLLDAGLKTDTSGDRILFPADVVEKAIADAPKVFTLYDRDGNPYTEIGGNNVHYTPGSSGLKILDHRTGQTRLSRPSRISSNTPVSATVSSTWPIRARLFRPTRTSSRRSPTPGGYTCC